MATVSLFFSLTSTKLFGQSNTVPRDTVMESQIRHEFGDVSLSHRVLGDFMAAARYMGEDLSRLLAWADFLSELKPVLAKNSGQAQGYFMFPEKTWLSLIEDLSDQIGLDAETQETDILALRFDPFVSGVVMVSLANQNAAKVGSDLLPNRNQLIVAHLFGAAAAQRLYKEARNAPDAPASFIFSAPQLKNSFIFYSGEDQRTLRELIRFFDAEISTLRAKYAQAERKFIDAETSIQTSAREATD